MNTLNNNPLDDRCGNTLKGDKIKFGKSYCLGEKPSAELEKVDLDNEDFLKKLTPELSKKIRDSIKAAEVKAQNILADAQQQGEILKSQAVEQGIQQGIEEGLQQGYQDGYNKALNDFREKVISLDRFIADILNAKKEIYHSGEDELLEFVMLLAEKLAHIQIKFDKKALKNIIVDASSELKEKEILKIIVNPELAQKIHSMADEIKSAIYGLQNLKIVEDRTVSPDGILIESVDSRVDARLATQVEALMEALTKEKTKKPILEEKEINAKSDPL